MIEKSRPQQPFFSNFILSCLHIKVCSDLHLTFLFHIIVNTKLTLTPDESSSRFLLLCSLFIDSSSTRLHSVLLLKIENTVD